MSTGFRFRPLLPLALALCAVAGVAALEAQEPASNPHGDLNTPCSACHRPEGWTPVRITSAFNHAKVSFPLIGAHAKASCRGCHLSLDFKGTPSACTSCHEDAHKGELGHSCESCHSTRSFVDHSEMLRKHELTRFPLRGTHSTTDCRDCHQPGAQGRMIFVNRTTLCADCHAPAFFTASNPDHIAGGFPRACDQCHTSTVWQGARFNHDGAGFPLTGAHRSVACQQCHVNSVYRGTKTDCISCHQRDYDGTTDPNHPSAHFPTDCTACHTTAKWSGASFDHATAGFPLTGAHQALACQQCHLNGVFAGTSAACVSCHQNDYNTTTDPSHVATQFPTDCSACHTTTAWTGATFNHSGTSFPLTGAHLKATCNDCHADGVYNGKSTACVSCHQNDYNTTTDPPHLAGHFPTDCASCHTTVGWPGATFNHDGPYFPIYSGTHRGRWTNCSDCHNVASDYAQFTCLTCHTKATTDSHHSGVRGYTYDSRACYSCHPTGTNN